MSTAEIVDSTSLASSSDDGIDIINDSNVPRTAGEVGNLFNKLSLVKV